MAEYEIPDNYEDLKSWMEEKESEQAEYRQQMPELAKLVESQRKIENELRAQLNEVARQRQQYQDQQDLIRKQVRADEAAIIAAKRKIETFASERAIAERLEREAEEFDRITGTYKWREFAFSYQLSGARRLASARRGILGDKRGLGKSLTSLIWADMVSAKRILVFAPVDVLQNFKREIEHWVPHRHVAVVGGMNKTQRDMFLRLLAGQEQYLILINYEAWRKDPEFINLLVDLKADTVIIDEAHNIKNVRTSAFQGIRDIVYGVNQCNMCYGTPERIKNPNGTGTIITRCSVCLHEPNNFDDFCSVKNVLPMTGTAFLNRPDDAWALLYLVNRVLFPSQNTFLRDYCTTNPNTGRWVFRPGGEEALIKKLGFKFVKRDKNSHEVKSEVRTMPQTIVKHDIEFDKSLYPDQWAVMEQIKHFDAILMAEDVKLDIIGLLPQLTRRRQAITWPAGIKIFEKDPETGLSTGRILYEAPATESIKMDKAMEIASTIVNEEEDRLVIFSQFKEALKEFERRFKKLDISVIRYDGDTSRDTAQAAQLDFDGKTAPNHSWGTECNADCVNHPSNNRYTGHTGTCPGYRWQVILAHYKKGGVGLNLNAARQAIFLDREWNPGKEDQAMGRIDRIDNLTDSVIHTLHVSESIDNFMDNLIEEKSKMNEGFDETYSDVMEELKQALKNGDLM
jgi:SNF2 family DNA or RNA helicase